MKKINLQVSGMHCASCATIINKALSKAKGIKEANINFSTSKAAVEFDETIISEKEIIETIKSKGYGAEFIKENDFEKQLEIQKKEIRNYRNTFLFSLIFAVPVFLTMVLMWVNIEIPYTEHIIWILSTPVQFIVGWQFYKGTWNTLKNKSANMDSLIAIGTSAAYFFSVYGILFNPESGQYFEISAILITLVVMGKWLESIAHFRRENHLECPPYFLFAGHSLWH